MATYYISPSGSDANNGLGPDASHASNKPWLTIGKALGAAGAASGDTIYLGPGTYREQVTANLTSPTVETLIVGDPLNDRGFKNGSGVPLEPQMVQWTGYDVNDTTLPSGSAAALALNARDFLTFQWIWFVAGKNSSTGGIIKADVNTSQNVVLRDCGLQSGAHTAQNLITLTCAANTPLNWTIERCIFQHHGGNNAIAITPVVHSAEYNINVSIKDCRFTGAGINVALGSTSSPGGGVTVQNCTFINCGNAVLTAGTNVPATHKVNVYDSFFYGTVGVFATTSGQIVENYNILHCNTPRTNVTAGANSISDFSRAPLFHFGQELQQGFALRPYTMPAPTSPLLGFGSNGSANATDLLNRTRPAGGGSMSNAVGAMERHDTAVKETTVTDAGGVAVKIVGPGDHELLIPVEATSTTLTIRARYDTNHAATNKPQVQLLAAGEIGVSTETKTMTSAVDTWETLTFSSFTPTAKGVVRLRLISRSAAGNGIAYFDTVTGGANGSQGFDYFKGAEPLQAAVSSVVGTGRGLIF